MHGDFDIGSLPDTDLGRMVVALKCMYASMFFRIGLLLAHHWRVILFCQVSIFGFIPLERSLV